MSKTKTLKPSEALGRLWEEEKPHPCHGNFAGHIGIGKGD